MNNMNGIYRVYEDGVLIAEQKNKLTVLGRANALKAMLGSAQSFASSMGIGIDGSDNDTSVYHNKTDLGFNVGKYPVVSSSLGNTETYDALVYTARITDQSRYNITELGLFANRVTSGFENENQIIFDFEDGDPFTFSVNPSTLEPDAAWYDIIEDPIPVFRISNSCLNMKNSSALATWNSSTINLSNVAPYDDFCLAANFGANAALTIKFESSSSDHATYTFAPGGTGYKVLSVSKSSPSSSSGTVDWSKINKITIDAGGQVYLDGLRIKKYRTPDSVEGLVSRAKLAAPIEKKFGSIIDIQYLLEVALETE
jgi:hypothetical protein